MVRRISRGSARKEDVAEELEIEDDFWVPGGVSALIEME
jgi:hypothetical protein